MEDLEVQVKILEYHVQAVVNKAAEKLCAQLRRVQGDTEVLNELKQ